jgi:HK97 family phage prohead protease
MSTLTALAEWKAADSGDPGELEGYMSIFGTPDQSGDIVEKGSFRKTLSDWSHSRQALPLIADHNLSTDGVVGSVVEAKEDGVGLRIRAKFASDQRSQDLRAKVRDGHVRGMSFTYEAIRHRMGQHLGKSVRFLEEIRLFEATITPFPLHLDAVASAKSGPGHVDVSDALAELERLEAWAAAYESGSTLQGLLDDPEGMANAAAVLVRAKSQQDLARLEAWADALPPRQPVDPTRPREMSTAERLNREAIARAYTHPPRSCGVCWRCQLGGSCAVYG